MSTAGVVSSDARTVSSGSASAPVVEVRGAAYVYAAGRGRLSRRIGPINLGVQPGERVAVIGPNGCGKSTLIHLLSGASTPSEGEVRWFGGTSSPAARRRIGVVFQSPSLDALLTVRETFWLAGRLLQMPSGEIEHRSAELADQLGIADRVDSQVGTLSGGLARRVDLARAILHRPDLLLLDEPTAGLDDESAAAFDSMLSEQVQAGVAVISATHTLDEVQAATRVIVMIEGRVAIDEAPRGGAGASDPATVWIESDSDELAAALGGLGLERQRGDVWRVDPREVSDESLAIALRAAVDAGARVSSATSSMHGYFIEAERALAGQTPGEIGGDR